MRLERHLVDFYESRIDKGIYTLEEVLDIVHESGYSIGYQEGHDAGSGYNEPYESWEKD